MTNLIAVSSLNRTVSMNHSSQQKICCVNAAVISCLESQGLTPILVPNTESTEGVERIIEMVDGLVLTSGQDLNPSTYKQKQKVQYRSDVSGLGVNYHRPLLMAPDLIRDKMEQELYRIAKHKNIPILGICRGMQIINVCEGGDLYQEMDEPGMQNHNIEEDGWIHYHDVQVVPNSMLFEIIQNERFTISTIHHQSVRKLGCGLRISARAEDGVIEAIEHLNRDYFILGIQGHIEKPSSHNQHMGEIWKAFANRVKGVHND